MVKKVEVYECPNGHYERTKERAVAWHLVELCKGEPRDGLLSFSAALEIIRHAAQVKALLDELPPPTWGVINAIPDKIAVVSGDDNA